MSRHPLLGPLLSTSLTLAAELIDNLSELIGRLHVHGVRSAIIVHAAAGAAVAAAACLQQLRQVARACECTTIAVPDSPVQQLLTLRCGAAASLPALALFVHQARARALLSNTRSL